MSSQRPKPFHYEDIPARGPERRFRVADAHDDVVTSFATEKEARDYVRDVNGTVEPRTDNSQRRY